MSQPHVNCPACGDLVELTKSGKLPRHRKQRDGRRVLSVCPGSGTAIDGQSRNHGLLAEVREWDRRIEKYVDELLDGGTKLATRSTPESSTPATWTGRNSIPILVSIPRTED